MKTSITSSVTPEQKEQCVRVVSDAARKGAGMAIDELVEAGIINKAKLQRVMAQGDKMATVVASVVKERIVKLADITGCLKRILDNEDIVIGPTDGTKILACAKDVFSCIKPNFISLDCGAAEEPTAETRVEVYQMIESATVQHIFGGFGQNLNRLCFTQAQVTRFTKDHKNLFCNEEHGTLFLFKTKAQKEKEQDEFFVAHVRLFSVGYFVADVLCFSSEIVRRAPDGYRVVVPELA